jgi:hypothetical protein
MSENAPQNAPQTPPTTPAPAPAEVGAAPGAEPGHGGWAVYDETLGQFVSRVYRVQGDATKAQKGGPKGHTWKVRKV